MKSFWRFLVPSIHNGYKPDSLERRAIAIMTVLVVGTFSFANIHSFLIVQNSWLSSNVLPAVLVRLTNEARADELGERELTRSTLLDLAAKNKAEHMAENGYFEHDSPDGVTPWHWFKDVGYDYRYAGENLAVLFTDSDDVVDAWLDSPSHRANIMNERYTEIGIGTARGEYKGETTVFVVQLFGTPKEEEEEAEPSPTSEPSLDARAPSSSLGTESSEEGDVRGTMESPEIEPVPTLEATTIDGEAETVVILDSEPASTPEEEVATTTNVVPIHASSTQPGETGEMGGEGNSLAPGHTASFAETEASFATPNTESTAFSSTPLVVLKALTQPHMLIAAVYLSLSLYVAVILTSAVVFEIRTQHLPQVAYGVSLLVGMAGLLSWHLSLTAGVLIS